MKRAYSDWQYQRKEFVAEYLAMKPEERMVIAKEILQKGGHMVDTASIVNELMITEQVLFMEKEAQEGRCLHLFFRGPGFHEWLGRCKTPLQAEAAAIMDQFRKSESDINGTAFMLHFESGAAPAYLAMWINGYINIRTQESSEKKVLYVACKGGHTYFFIPENMTGPGDDPEQERVGHLIASAIAYMQAFPEQVLDGIPADLKHPNHYRRQRATTIGMAPRLVERDGPSPHYRVGHFRLLSSERFKNKRGQVVFVSGSFVKGKAETVHEIS